jgi:hypothetical protein
VDACETKDFIANSIQFFIIYVPTQQLQGQLQTQHSVDNGNYGQTQHNDKDILQTSTGGRKQTNTGKVNKKKR